MYFPLDSGVMIPFFGYGKINASSSAVEAEFNDIKNRLLKNEARPMRVDKFVTRRIRSFSGRAKLAMSSAGLSNDFAFPGFTNVAAEISSSDRHDKQSAEVSDHKCDSMDIDEKLDDVLQRRDAKDFKKSLNVDDVASSIESSTSLSDAPLNQNYLQLNKSSHNNRSPAKSNNVPCTDIEEDTSDLLHEHNWRNKNNPKKPRRSYLDPCSDWDTRGAYNKKAVGIIQLQNGNICPVLTIKKNKIVVKNTCGFDSIVHILANACEHDSFRTIIDNAETDCFKFIKNYLQWGPCPKIYKTRALLLQEVAYFVEKDTLPGITAIDATSNVCNLCEYVFKDEPSYMEISLCLKCKKKKDLRNFTTY